MFRVENIIFWKRSLEEKEEFILSHPDLFPNLLLALNVATFMLGPINIPIIDDFVNQYEILKIFVEFIRLYVFGFISYLIIVGWDEYVVLKIDKRVKCRVPEIRKLMIENYIKEINDISKSEL